MKHPQDPPQVFGQPRQYGKLHMAVSSHIFTGAKDGLPIVTWIPAFIRISKHGLVTKPEPKRRTLCADIVGEWISFRRE